MERFAHDLQPGSYATTPVVECMSDSDAGLDRSALIAAAIGARVRRIAGLEEAHLQLAQGTAADALLLDLTTDAGPALDRLFDQLEAGAQARRFRAILCLPPALIDPATARIGADPIVLLCQPGEAEIAAELGLALALRAPAMVREHDDELGLRRLSEEVGRIARALAELSGTGAAPHAGRPVTATDPAAAPGTLPSAGAVRAMLRARRLRDQFFQADLFADPAWDMLLDLLLARLEGRMVAVSSLCIGAAVPPTTALRWIKRLTDEGLFVRAADPDDGRRIFIDLSDAAANGLAAYFRALARTGIALT
jgi:hypothetical protein